MGTDDFFPRPDRSDDRSPTPLGSTRRPNTFGLGGYGVMVTAAVAQPPTRRITMAVTQAASRMGWSSGYPRNERMSAPVLEQSSAQGFVVVYRD